MWSNSAAFIKAHEEITKQTIQIRGYVAASAASATSNAIGAFASNASAYASNTVNKASNAISFASNTSFWTSNVVNEWILACQFMGNIVVPSTGAAEVVEVALQKSGSDECTTDVNGEGFIDFEEAFLNTYKSSVVCNGDPSLTLCQVFVNSNSDKSAIGISLRPNPGMVVVRVNWISTGS